jgi:hypothetical protein
MSIESIVDDYVLCLCKLDLPTFADCRRFAKKVFEAMGLQLRKVDVRFSSKQENKKYIRFRYTEENRALADRYPLTVIHSASFQYLKRNHDYFELFIDFNSIEHEGDIYKFQYDAVRIMRKNVEGGAESVRHLGKVMAEILDEVSSIKYLVADRMGEDRAVQWFIFGGGSPLRNWFENAVAHNISKSVYTHHQLPFLFFYNYFNCRWLPSRITSDMKDAISSTCGEYVEITFPRCFGKTLDEYALDPEWKRAYTFMESSGAIVFPESCKTSAKRDAEVDEVLARKAAERQPEVEAT